VQLAAVAPVLAVTEGSTKGGASAEARIRNPCEPVSTWILSIVWHVLVPGMQIVTLVCSMLRVPVVIFATVMGCTLGVVD
jgi:hypothetical protein